MIEEWKEKGNAAYKQRDWSKAIEFYSKAMDVPVTQEQLLTEGKCSLYLSMASLSLS